MKIIFIRKTPVFQWGVKVNYKNVPTAPGVYVMHCSVSYTNGGFTNPKDYYITTRITVTE